MFGEEVLQRRRWSRFTSVGVVKDKLMSALDEILSRACSCLVDLILSYLYVITDGVTNAEGICLVCWGVIKATIFIVYAGAFLNNDLFLGYRPKEEEKDICRWN